MVTVSSQRTIAVNLASNRRQWHSVLCKVGLNDDTVNELNIHTLSKALKSFG